MDAVATKPVATTPPSRPVASPVPGWTPEAVTAVPSARRERAQGVLDALRGVAEPAPGQRLSPAMIDALSGHLSTSFGLSADVVRSDLAATNLYVGGPGGFGGSSGIALGPDIYVPDARTLDHILSWNGRRFLAHELGHVMQWRRDYATDGVDEATATRRYLLDYGKRSVLEGWGPGAAPRGMWRWLASRVPGSDRPDRRLATEIHDAHAMEAESEAQAVRFRDATAQRAT